MIFFTNRDRISISSSRVKICKVQRKEYFVVSIFLLAFCFSVIIQPFVNKNVNAIELAEDNLALSQTEGSTEGGDEVDIIGQKSYFENKKIIQTSLSGAHVLALDSDGSIYAWGNGSGGRLGNGAATNSSLPVKVDASGVLLGKKVVQISAGTTGSLALDSEGQVYAWGYGMEGALGNGLNVNSLVPVIVNTSMVPEGREIVQILAGNSCSYMLDSEGQIYAWGRNSSGQLGIGSTTNVSIPTEVNTSGVLNNKKITSISAGNARVFAIDESGKVYSWGSNMYGSLGNGVTTSSSVAVEVLGLPQDKKIVQVAGGTYHTLALDSEGAIYAWGYNTNGQLGNNSKTNSLSPVMVDASGVLNGKEVAAISAGSYSSFALDEDGLAYSWGTNSYAALGNGSSSVSDSKVPIMVEDFGVLSQSKLEHISSGSYSSIVLDLDGSVYAWGLNTDGQLGNGETVNSYSPVKVSFGEELSRTISSVTFGGVEVIDFEVIDDEKISVVVPPHVAGKVDVVITDNEGHTWTIQNGYEYIEEQQPPVTPPSVLPDEDIEAPNTGA